MAGSSSDEPAKALLPFLQRADELQKHDSLVAYYCRLYAMDQGLKIPAAQRTKETSDLLLSLMAQLEKDKATVRRSPEDNFHVEGFAQRVFEKADKQDRAGKADISTAKTFYAAGIFLEVASQFGPLPPELEQKQKYAVWKAGDIRKALKEGRAPAPGPPGGDDNMKTMFGSSSVTAPSVTSSLGPPAAQAPSPLPHNLSFSANQTIPSLDAFGLPHAPSRSPSLSSQTAAANLHSSSGLPVAMPVNPAHYSAGQAGTGAYNQLPSAYPQGGGQYTGAYPSTTQGGQYMPTSSGQNPAYAGNSGASQGHNPRGSAYGGSTGSQFDDSQGLAPSAPPPPVASGYPSSAVGMTYSSQGNSSPYSAGAGATYAAPSSNMASGGPSSDGLRNKAVGQDQVAGPGSLPSVTNGTAGMSLNSSVLSAAFPGGAMSAKESSTPGFGYSQPPPGKVAEAHKAARFAVSSLAFDDVPTAVEYLKKALDLLSKS